MAIDGLKVLYALLEELEIYDQKYHARFQLESIIYLFLLRLHEHLSEEVEDVVECDFAGQYDLKRIWMFKECLDFDGMALRLLESKTFIMLRNCWNHCMN